MVTESRVNEIQNKGHTLMYVQRWVSELTRCSGLFPAHGFPAANSKAPLLEIGTRVRTAMAMLRLIV